MTGSCPPIAGHRQESGWASWKLFELFASRLKPNYTRFSERSATNSNLIATNLLAICQSKTNRGAGSNGAGAHREWTGVGLGRIPEAPKYWKSH